MRSNTERFSITSRRKKTWGIYPKIYPYLGRKNCHTLVISCFSIHLSNISSNLPILYQYYISILSSILSNTYFRFRLIIFSLYCFTLYTIPKCNYCLYRVVLFIFSNFLVFYLYCINITCQYLHQFCLI